MEILENLYKMTALGDLVVSPGTILMLLIGFMLLYLGIKKQFEPLLLVPIALGVLLANFPGGNMGVIPSGQNDEIMHMTLLEIAKEYGIMNLIYYATIKTGLLPPIIFMGVGALTDFPLYSSCHRSTCSKDSRARRSNTRMQPLAREGSG